MKQPQKKQKRDPIILDFETLVQQVKKQYNQNKHIYNQIINIYSDFSFQLYQPAIPSYQTRQQLGKAKQQLVQLYDLLTQQSEKLSLQLNRFHLKTQQLQAKKQQQIMLSMDNFTFLRKQWQQSQLQITSISKVQHLIHNIGVIKGNLLNVIKKQSKLTQSPPDIHQLVISSPQYCQLLKNYQELKYSHLELQHSKQNQKLSNSSNHNIPKPDQQLPTKSKQPQQSQHTTIKSSNDQENQNTQSQQHKNIIYKISSTDKTYNLYIQQLNKIPNDQFIKQNNTIKSITSKQSLQAILKFLQSQATRKSIKGIESPTQQSRSRIFTVQQIAKPKFISHFVHLQKPIQPPLQ